MKQQLDLCGLQHQRRTAGEPAGLYLHAAGRISACGSASGGL